MVLSIGSSDPWNQNSTFLLLAQSVVRAHGTLSSFIAPPPFSSRWSKNHVHHAWGWYCRQGLDLAAFFYSAQRQTPISWITFMTMAFRSAVNTIAKRVALATATQVRS